MGPILTVKSRRRRRRRRHAVLGSSCQLRGCRLHSRGSFSISQTDRSPTWFPQMKTVRAATSSPLFSAVSSFEAAESFTVLVLSHRDSVMSELITTLAHGGLSPLQRARAQISLDSFSSVALKRSYRRQLFFCCCGSVPSINSDNCSNVFQYRVIKHSYLIKDNVIQQGNDALVCLYSSIKTF